MKQTPGHQSVSEIGGRFVIRLLRILVGSIAKIFADERDSVENDRYHDRGKNRCLQAGICPGLFQKCKYESRAVKREQQHHTADGKDLFQRMFHSRVRLLYELL